MYRPSDVRHRPRPSRPGSGVTSWYQSMLDPVKDSAQRC